MSATPAGGSFYVYSFDLGTLVRVKPKLFLEVMKAYREQDNIIASNLRSFFVLTPRPILLVVSKEAGELTSGSNQRSVR
jgi:hypothetical protein